jgi:hypothetical protein
MTMVISSWRRDRSHRAMVRELKALSPHELGALGIRPTYIDHLALEASHIPMARGPLPDYWTPIRFVFLIVAFAAPVTAGLRLWLGYAP